MSTSNPLFQNLVPAAPTTSDTSGKSATSFSDAMAQMGISSVFDIIRQPKQAFARQLSTLSDANGELAYDNALCYASQIGRSYREDVVSSGRSVADVSQRSGVRALVDIGPSYPNLFRENWDQFCKVGAIEAMDGPVAYLGSLRRFAEQRIEGASDSPKRIPLSVRRPDLDKLVIDEQSTYQSIPMLELVNRVLTEGIDKYQVEKGDARPVQELLAEKKHPFVFPYHFAHQQVSLALAGDKPGLGEINYDISPALSGVTAEGSLSEPRIAQLALGGLSPSMHRILTSPSEFDHFYLSLSRLSADATFLTPSAESLRSTRRHNTGFLIQSQENATSVTPGAREVIWSQDAGPTIANLRFEATGNYSQGTLNLTSRDYPYSTGFLMNSAVVYGGTNAKVLGLHYPGDEASLENLANHQCTLTIDATAHTTLEDWIQAPRLLAPWRFTFFPEQDYSLTERQQAFFLSHYGVSVSHSSGNPLIAVEGFLQASHLDSEQLEGLLAIKTFAPIRSVNLITTNRAAAGRENQRAFPLSNHYGACYVNGLGGTDPGTRDYSPLDNSMNVAQSDADRKWYLTNTSLERFDRLQRMIRLQKATGIPFAHLDTLMFASMRSEGDANAAMDINDNTLRAIGVYRYFNRHYDIDAEEFAALLYYVSPYAATGKLPLLDRAFNTPLLFDIPLVIDDAEFSLSSTEPGHQRTVAQLCNGLGVEPGEELALIAADTLTFVTPLKRSLAVVSSLYRQARIARMFNLSVRDYWTLCQWLGGSEYRQRLAAGRLKTLDSSDKDILDILMELDQAVRWLKDKKTTVAAVRTLLEVGPVPAPSEVLLQRLNQLAADARANAVTAATVAALNLPTTATGTAIDWYTKLGQGAQAIIDENGLVNAPPFERQDNDAAHLQAKVQTLIATLTLDPDAAMSAQARLSEFLLIALTQQQRLVEAFMQEHTGLMPELAVLTARCAEVPAQAMLTQVLRAWPADAPANEAIVSEVIASLHLISQCTQGVSWTAVGAQALRTFLVNPTWLGVDKLWPQTLGTLHLLKAYEGLLNTLGQPEERLLGYLELANPASSRRLGKRQLAAHAQSCNAELASLLGWRESEVAVLTAKLPEQIAKTVSHIDWLRRSQAVALQTGLDTATLLKACGLNVDSPDADWQAVGQAAMAATA